jgi:hypothetical protein
MGLVDTHADGTEAVNRHETRRQSSLVERLGRSAIDSNKTRSKARPPAPPRSHLLRQLRSLLRRRSLRASAQWLRFCSLNRLRRYLAGRTQGQAEAVARAAARRGNVAAVRRPATRGAAEPTAATDHAAGAPSMPAIHPFPQLTMNVE